jgi:hypothetical protein
MKERNGKSTRPLQEKAGRDSRLSGAIRKEYE